MFENDLQVGDLINCEFGMYIPVDGIMITSTYLEVDERDATGNTIEVKKETFEECVRQN